MTFTWKEFKTQVEKLGVKNEDVIDCIYLAATHTSQGLDVRHLPNHTVMIHDVHNGNQSILSTKEPA